MYYKKAPQASEPQAADVLSKAGSTAEMFGGPVAASVADSTVENIDTPGQPGDSKRANVVKPSANFSKCTLERPNDAKKVDSFQYNIFSSNQQDNPQAIHGISPDIV